MWELGEGYREAASPHRRPAPPNPPSCERSKAGRLSAARTEDGSWSIDPVELNRCFPLLAVPGAPSPQPQPEHDAMADVLVAELRAMLADVRRERDLWREAHGAGQAALTEGARYHAPAARTPARNADRTGRNVASHTQTSLVEAGRVRILRYGAPARSAAFARTVRRTGA